jgi:hypothetical protein
MLGSGRKPIAEGEVQALALSMNVLWEALDIPAASQTPFARPLPKD